jgi:ABC-type transport system substrate-binding protein
VRFDIEIRPDAAWENGSPVTARDYLFTLKAIRMPLNNTSRYRDVLQYIAGVEIDKQDEKKFTVYLKEDNMNALESCIQWEIYPAYYYDPDQVMEKLDLEKLNTDSLYEKSVMADSSFIDFAEAFNGLDFSSRKISGSGPYTFSGWEANQYIVLEKKKDYWGAKTGIHALENNPDKIVFHIIADEVAALVQLKDGQIDVMSQVRDEDFLDMKNSPEYKDKFHFFSPSLTKYYVILMNNADPKLNDKNVRRAIAHLIDVDYVLNNLENGLGQRLNTPVHPQKPYYNQKLKPLTFDIEKAKSLLAEAGWTDSDKNGVADKVLPGGKTELSLDMYVSGQELGKQVAILLQQNAVKAGIKINIIEKEFKLVRAENLKTRNYHLVPSVVSNDLNYWDDLSLRYHSKYDNPKGANDISYRNDQADAIFDRIPFETDLKVREDLYRQVQEIIYDDQAMVYLYVPSERIIVNKIWKGNATMKRPGYAVNEFEMIGRRKPQ